MHGLAERKGLMNSRARPVCNLPLTPALRRRLEATVEQLIGLLDEIDGDPDLEEPDTDAEPDADTEPNGDEAEDDARDWPA